VTAPLLRHHPARPALSRMCCPRAAAYWGGKPGAPREAAGEAKDESEKAGDWDAGPTWNNVVRPVFYRAFKELCGKALSSDLTPQAAFERVAAAALANGEAATKNHDPVGTCALRWAQYDSALCAGRRVRGAAQGVAGGCQPVRTAAEGAAELCVARVPSHQGGARGAR
jgi:hypothetical protein